MRGIALGGLGRIVVVHSLAGCCLGGGSDAGGETWARTFDGADVVVRPSGVHVAVGISPELSIVTLDAATGTTTRTTTLELPASGAMLQRLTDPRRRSLAFLETQGTSVVAVHVFDGEAAHRVAMSDGVDETDVSLQAGLVVVVRGDEVIALRDDGEEAWRVTMAGVHQPHGVWNESSNAVVVEDASEEAHALAALDGRRVEDLDVEPGSPLFLTDRHVLRIDGDAVVARVRGETATDVSIADARGWVEGDNWIAFLGADRIVLRNADLTPLGPDVVVGVPEFAGAGGDRLVLAPPGGDDAVRVVDVRASTVREVGRIVSTFEERVFASHQPALVGVAGDMAILSANGTVHAYALR